MRWKNKLTKKELIHLKEMGIYTLKGMKENVEHQRKLDSATREETGFASKSCWDCHFISKKLGL